MAAVDTYASASSFAYGDKLVGIQGGAVVQVPNSVLNVAGGTVTYVDSVNGSDSTGVRGSARWPFLTPLAAQTAASSGDCIDVLPGSYTLTSALGKNGVNWNLRPGVTLTRSNGTGSIFDDGGSAMTFKVMGLGTLALSGSVTSGIAAGVKATHASSDILIECFKIDNQATDDGGNCAAVYQAGGTMRVKADTINNGVGSSNPYAVWWVNGAMSVKARIINSDAGYCVAAIVTATPTGDCFIEADQITGLFAIVANRSTGQTEAKLWVRANLMSATNSGALFLSGGKTYVTAQKIVGCTASGDAGSYVVNLQGATAKCWIDAQKITATYGSAIGLNAGGQIRATVQQIEDLGHMDNAAVTTVSATSSLLELNGAQCVMAVGDGVSHSAGTCRLMGCRFDTSASSGKNPATVAGSGLILDHCTLVAQSAADSVTAASGKTITNYGSKFNRAKNANITVNVDTISADANVV